MLVPGIVASFPQAPGVGNPANLIADEQGNTMRARSGLDVVYRPPILPSPGSTILLRMEDTFSIVFPSFGDGTTNETGVDLWAITPNNFALFQPPTLNTDGDLSIFPSRLGPMDDGMGSTTGGRFSATSLRDTTRSNWPDADDGTLWGLVEVRHDPSAEGFSLFMDATDVPQTIEFRIRMLARSAANTWFFSISGTGLPIDRPWQGISEDFIIASDNPVVIAMTKTKSGYSFYASGVGEIPIDVAGSDPAIFDTYSWFGNIKPLANPDYILQFTTGSEGDFGHVIYAMEVADIPMTTDQLDTLSAFVLQTV